AQEAKSRAERILSSKDPNMDYRRAELALLRAISRLDAVKHRVTRH
ncbi:MAG: ATP synthase delta/epsilon chain alpha-helix domain-containing protein, partial [Acidobacteriota bacterium]